MLAKLTTMQAAQPLWEAWTAYQITGSLSGALAPVLGFVVARVSPR